MTVDPDNAAFAYVQRVRPQECAASTALGHPRYLEFFEAAFIECWRERFGALHTSLGPARRLTVAAVNVRYLAAAHADDELRIEVTLEPFTKHSIQVRYEAWIGRTHVAQASSRYVCLDSRTDRPAPWPGGIAGS